MREQKGKRLKLSIGYLVLITFAIGGVFIGDSPVRAETSGTAKTVEKLRKKLVTLTDFGAFDSIDFSVDDSKVTLQGFVSRPTLKSAAERVSLSLEAIDLVDNLIEVLPVSPNDDRIRVRAYAAIYGHPALSRYAPGGGVSRYDRARFASDLHFGLQSAQQPRGPHPIHIIVKDGNVTLVGFIDSEAAKNIAGITVNGLPGVFSVTNNIQVAAS
jgi:osmotically-inducible protein OsmY